MAGRRNISGRYRSTGGAQELELRVDVGSGAPVDPVTGVIACVSGDLFDVVEDGLRYVGSFIAQNVTRTSPKVVEGRPVQATSGLKPLIEGRTIRVTVGFSSSGAAKPASAQVEFLDGNNQPPVVAHTCRLVDRNFREVTWELVRVGDARAFTSFDTKSRRHGRMTVIKAFERAGVKLRRRGAIRVLEVANADDEWSNAELHFAMREHFRSWRNRPQWNVCVLVAPYHELSQAGVMFDLAKPYPRQGCAVFSGDVDWSDHIQKRDQLHTYAHEIGHCFNIPHSFMRAQGAPLLLQGLGQGHADLSWMNYPSEYASPTGDGEDAYWEDFGYRFMPDEVKHLRHAFYDDIVPGGSHSAFAAGGAAAMIPEQVFHPRPSDTRRLKLELRAGRDFVLGEPVIIEAKLSLVGDDPHPIHADLHPHHGYMQIGIRGPDGLRLYRPPMFSCAGKARTENLDADRPCVYKSAYVGYGRDGHYFGRPGRYELVACYTAPDGSRVVTDPEQPPLVIDIASQHATPQDREVAELLLGEQQGMLFWLGGSDELPELAAGVRALDKVALELNRHPLARYLLYLEGINLGRSFKRLTVDARGRRKLSVRPVMPEKSAQALGRFVEGFRGDLTFDNLTLNYAMRRWARSTRLTKSRREADEILESILPTFVKRVADAKGEDPEAVKKRIGKGIQAQVDKERKRWSLLDAGRRARL